MLGVGFLIELLDLKAKRWVIKFMNCSLGVFGRRGSLDYGANVPHVKFLKMAV